jgi:hypothetical protein
LNSRRSDMPQKQILHTPNQPFQMRNLVVSSHLREEVQQRRRQAATDAIDCQLFL